MNNLLQLKKYLKQVDANKRAGFTLIELLIVIFISSILLVGLLFLYSWHLKVYSYQQAMVGVAESSRMAGDSLYAYIGQANRVLPQITIDGVEYISATTSIALRLPVLDNNGIPLANVFDTAVFYLLGDSLFFKLSPNAQSHRLKQSKQIASKIKALLFDYDNQNFDLVRTAGIDMINERQSSDGAVVQSRLKENIKLKNHE